MYCKDYKIVKGEFSEMEKDKIVLEAKNLFNHFYYVIISSTENFMEKQKVYEYVCKNVLDFSDNKIKEREKNLYRKYINDEFDKVKLACRYDNYHFSLSDTGFICKYVEKGNNDEILREIDIKMFLGL